MIIYRLLFLEAVSNLPKMCEDLRGRSRQITVHMVEVIDDVVPEESKNSLRKVRHVMG